ncbi:MAG: GntR family transcriptional regulator [Oscillospiraceae bacterium]|nr:GntR family transcriptional regulator [Oscillospiraceae bacterium]
MISFDRFVMEEGSPIYLQIIRFMKREDIAGRISDGDELPSRRVLSALLGVNPNTVQKAYRMLEEEGLIQSHSGAKSYMVLSGKKIGKITAQLLEAEARNAVRTLKQMGLSREEAIALFKRFWE